MASSTIACTPGRCLCTCDPRRGTAAVVPDRLGTSGLQPIALVFKVCRMQRGLRQSDLARVMPAGNAAAYLSRLEAGKERPELAKLAEIEFAFSTLCAPLSPREIRLMEAAVLTPWTPEDAQLELEDGAELSEIQNRLADLLNRRFRTERAKRLRAKRGGKILASAYLLKYTLLISM